MTKGPRPFSRSRTHTIRIQATDAAGEPITLELHAEQWLHAKTGRYRWVFSARQAGRLGWEASSSPREALRRAAFIPVHKRPAWLAAGVRRAEALRDNQHTSPR